MKSCLEKRYMIHLSHSGPAQPLLTMPRQVAGVSKDIEHQAFSRKYRVSSQG